MGAPGVGLGELVLALDSTLVTLVTAPRGLDLPVRSAALVDADDLDFGFPVSATPSDVYFLLGVGQDDAARWITKQANRATDSSVHYPAGHGLPAAIFVKNPSETLVGAAEAAGLAVVSVQPQARWDRLYRLVTHVFDHRGNRAAPFTDTGTDLFALAQSVAERTNGMVSIEDAQSHLLAYSAANDEADELRRLSILGRAGPPDHLRWLVQWGIFDALRTGTRAVPVAERPEFGIQPRLAIGIHRRDLAPTRPSFIGTIWIQQGSSPLTEDAAEILRGAAVLAARIMNRLEVQPSAHRLRAQQLLGLTTGVEHDDISYAALARELGLAVDESLAVIGFHSPEDRPRIADALALGASAFRPEAQIVPHGSRTYVVFPDSGRAVVSWVRGSVNTLGSELGVQIRAVIAAPVEGLAAVATARVDIDHALDSAVRHPGTISPVTTLAETRTTVILDKIIATLSTNEHLVDPRVLRLRHQEPALCETLQSYLDCFGDIAKAAAELQVHPNTVRYRVRRLETLLAASLSDPDVRLVLALSLRAIALRATS